MPIIGDIMKIGGGEEINQEFDPNFFSTHMSIEEEPRAEKEITQPANALEGDWMTVINRMFMKGMTAQNILDAIGEQINSLQNAQEILKYIQKYEGLIGTIFIDSKVLENGFPMAMIPKGWNQFHRYSIHCEHPITKTIQTAEGGLSGDIDMFLSSSDKNVKREEEVCSMSGLPVLKAGMFSAEVISGIMESLGRKGDKLSDLQSAMKEIALHLNQKSAEKVEFEKADIKFGLQNQKLNVNPQEEVKTDMNPIKYHLKQYGKVEAKIQKAPPIQMHGYKLTPPKEKIQIAPARETSIGGYKLSLPKEEIQISSAEETPIRGIKMEYKKSSKPDVKMNHIQSKVKDVKIDEELRY